MQQLLSNILLIFSFLVQASLVQTTALAKNSAPSILILGDSLSAAYNIPVEQSWPNLFTNNIRARYPDASVNNASISGETTYGGLQRLPALLKRIKPSHLIIELGGNDGLRGLKFSQTKSNMNNIVSLAQEQDIDVLLVGVDLPPNLGPVYNQRFQEIFASVVESHNIDYLGHFLDGVAASDAELMQADGIHPTVLAQPILAQKVISAITSMLEN